MRHHRARRSGGFATADFDDALGFPTEIDISITGIAESDPGVGGDAFVVRGVTVTRS